jgi:tetratricopeptide (TPR) repeat protein
MQSKFSASADSIPCSKRSIINISALKPDNFIAYGCLGLIYIRLEDYDKAIHNYSRAIDLKKDFTLAYKQRGQIYYEKENYL